MDIQVTANKLKIYSPKMIYSSDLDRDSESAKLIAEILGHLPYEVDYALRTADMGVLSGAVEGDVRNRILQWYEHPGEPAPSGESRYSFEKRVWQFMEPKIELARTCAAFRPTIFVAHGRVQAFLDAYYNMKLPQEADMSMPAGFAVIRSNPYSLDSFEFTGETEPILIDV